MEKYHFTESFRRMGLHERIISSHGDLAITRVPGGWLYQFWRVPTGAHMQDGDWGPPVFVPEKRDD
jgi:hypothetical protein